MWIRTIDRPETNRLFRRVAGTDPIEPSFWPLLLARRPFGRLREPRPVRGVLRRIATGLIRYTPNPIARA